MKRYPAWEDWYIKLMLVRMLHVMLALHYLSCVLYMNRIYRHQHQVNPAQGFLSLVLQKITALKIETWAVKNCLHKDLPSFQQYPWNMFYFNYSEE